MKKKLLLLLILFSFFLTGCKNIAARDAVIELLEEYRNLSDDVIISMEKVIKNEGLDDEQSEVYRSILKKQYQDLEYEIISESYNGDDAIVETKITVYDLYKPQEYALDYAKVHPEEFAITSDTYDEKLFIDYKLAKMLDATDRIIYTISFNVSKDENNQYQIVDLNTEILEKIHGMYDYSDN